MGFWNQKLYLKGLEPPVLNGGNSFRVVIERSLRNPCFGWRADLVVISLRYLNLKNIHKRPKQVQHRGWFKLLSTLILPMIFYLLANATIPLQKARKYDGIICRPDHSIYELR